MKIISRLFACLIVFFSLASPAFAHDPFDGNLQLTIHPDGIELTATLGTDAARAYLAAIHAPRTGDEPWTDLPLADAPSLAQLSVAGKPLPPLRFATARGEMESTFRIVYPLPATKQVEIEARYFQLIEYMKPGTLLALTPERRLLASAILNRDKPKATVPLTAGAFNGAHMADYFRLGVEHILHGFDHLLFLAALLIGVTRIRAMLVIISGFTLGHSVTLALAAFDVVVLPASVVEPVIAASIVVVALDNLLRRSEAKHRYWAAAVFGLIHGFGFAGILRETMLAGRGQSQVEALLRFNLGIETGQLLVAAVFVPLLLALRRHTWFDRRGAPALSLLVMGVSAMWLVERIAG